MWFCWFPYSLLAEVAVILPRLWKSVSIADIAAMIFNLSKNSITINLYYLLCDRQPKNGYASVLLDSH